MMSAVETLKRLRTALAATYSLSPEGRAELALIDEALAEAQKPVMWVQSNHLSVFQNLLPGSSLSLALCSSFQAQDDFIPLYLAPSAQAVAPEDIHRDAMRYRALRNIPAEYPAVFAHSGADDYGWFPVDGADLDEVSDVLITAVPKPENP